MVRAGTSRGKHRLGRALVVGEIALALTLLSGASLAIYSVWKLEHVDVGLKTDHVLTFFLPLPETRSKDAGSFCPHYVHHRTDEKVRRRQRYCPLPTQTALKSRLI